MVLLSFHDGHDSNACVLIDGHLSFHVEAERLTRLKHQPRAVETAIDRCLQLAKLRPADVDFVAYTLGYNTPFRMAHQTPKALMSGITGSTSAAPTRFDLWGTERPALVVRHHVAHAASAFFTSPYDRAMVLTYDGEGDMHCRGSLGYGSGNSLKIFEFLGLGRPYLRNLSIGIATEAISEWCFGQPGDVGPGKLAGLAAYGRIRAEWLPAMAGYARHLCFDEAFRREFLRDGAWNLPFFKECSPDVPFAGREHTSEAQDFLRTWQEACEIVIAEELAALRKRCVEEGYDGVDQLCIGGGCGLNGATNAKLAASVNALFVPPFTSDCGLSVGAAYYAWHVHLGNARQPFALSPYLGGSNEIGEREVAEFLDLFDVSAGITTKPPEAVITSTAEALAEGELVGWVQGRSEVGPRALGNRSILADPSNEHAVERLTKVVKRREWYRPYAPAVPEDDAGTYFDINRDTAPFMLSFVRCKDGVASRLRHIVHIDHTSRVQTVAADANPRFYQLLKEFKRRSGFPILLNTSFNIPGESIVDSYGDAIKTFARNGLDRLVLGNHIVKRR